MESKVQDFSFERVVMMMNSQSVAQAFIECMPLFL